MSKRRRVAVVTGAAGGIGQALVKVFAEEGYRVIGIDRVKPRVRRGEWINFDLTELHGQSVVALEFIRGLRDLCGRHVDALINNAAVQIVKPVAEIEPLDWQQTLAANLLAPFWLVHGLLTELRRAQGSVVNIASIHALQTKSNFALYATSKAALVGLTRSLALELAPHVRVNAVLPAATATAMLRAGFTDNPGGLHRLKDYHPLKRIAAPEEVAQAALFLSGAKAAFITGAALAVDGGISGALSDPEPHPHFLTLAPKVQSKRAVGSFL